MQADQQAPELPRKDKLRLIACLWDSLVGDQGDDLPLDPNASEVLDRRLEAYRANPEELLAWAEIRARFE